MLRHERRQSLRFAPLEGELGAAIRARHPEVRGVDSMIWVEPASGGERVSTRSAAALRVARYMGGPWRAAAVAYVVPAFLRDALYDLIARHRHRLVSGPESCYLPPPEVRARFLA